MLKRVFFVVFLAGLALAFQGPLPVPECQGAECTDDVTHEDHAGSPAWCQNYDTAAWAKNCGCHRECDETVGSECKTYCRTKRCRCDHGCDSR